MEEKFKKHLNERRKAKQGKNSFSVEELDRLQQQAAMDLNRMYGSRGSNTTPTPRPSDTFLKRKYRKESK